MTIFHRKSLLLFMILFLNSSVFSITYYVDSYAGNNSSSGTSVSTAWKTISKVNAVHFYPGDVILFKRNCIFTETLNINYSGTSSQPIIYGSYGSGKPPVIDGGAARTNCIYLSGKSNVIIKEFKLTNTGTLAGSGAIRIKYANYVTVRDCDIYVTGRAGVFVENSTFVTVLKNIINTPAGLYNVQTDGIYSQRNSNNTYDGNYIVISNQHTTPHCDGIQHYLDTDGTICNNYIEQNNTKTGNAQGIYCEMSSGTFKIFNNVCYGMYTTSSLIKFKGGGSVVVIGNSIYGGKSQLFVTDDPYVVFKNNIIQTTGSSAPVTFEKVVPNTGNINYNMYKRSTYNNSIINYAGSYKKLSEWKTLGFDTKGIESDPQFNNPLLKDMTLKVTSPALNKGILLSAPFNLDKLGNLRPSGKSAEMGAFEYMGFDKDGFVHSTQEDYRLSQNYPNPFNPATIIKFSLPKDEEVNLQVYDILGNLVSDITSGFLPAGSHEYDFNGSNLASGTYIYVLRTRSFVETKKMILLK